MIKHYGSIADMCNAYLALGNRSASSAFIQKGRYGDTSLVSLAEAQIAAIETQIETPRQGWERSPAGPFCSVPDVLAGLPTPMRRRKAVPNENAPITIIVGTASSGGIGSDVYTKRGITIVALVMALARVRPISLHIMDPGYGDDKDGETVIMARVNTTPFDLAVACYVLTDINFTRTVMYDLERHVTGKVTWPREYMSNPNRYYAGLCSRMGLLQKDTLIIRDAYLSDPIITQQVEWINTQIRHFTQQNADEEYAP